MTNRPLSTALQRRIADNIVDIYERGDCVALPVRVSNTSLTDYEGDRPWTSVDWACVWVCPIEVSRNLASMTVHFLGRVWNEYAGVGEPDPSVEVELRVEGEGAARLVITETTARYRPYSITLDLTSREPRALRVSLWVRSGEDVFAGALAGLFVDDVTGRFRSVLESPAGTPYADGTDPQPATDSPDLFATSPDDVTEQTERYDHIRADNVATGKTNDRRMAAYPLAYTWTAGVDGRRRPLSYVQVRCITLRTTYDGSALYNPRELRANIRETSEVAQKHLRLQDEIYRRPALLSIGLEGGPTPSGGQWPAGYRQGWPYLTGADLESLLYRSIAPLDASARVTLRALFAGVHVVENAGTTPGDFDSLLNGAASASWDVRFELSQDGFAINDDVTTTAPVAHYPTDFRLNSRLSFQQYWAAFTDPAVDYSWVYREGLLYAEDFALLTPVTVSFVPNGFNYDNPVVLSVHAERNSGVTPTYQQGSTTERVPGNLRLVLVGLSVQRERL
jgi:hypothetical protein